MSAKSEDAQYPGLRDALAEAGNGALHYRPRSYSEHRDLDADEMTTEFIDLWLRDFVRHIRAEELRRTAEAIEDEGVGVEGFYDPQVTHFLRERADRKEQQ